MFRNFYQNKKVLITGHTGFKGSWLTLWLNLLGAKVIGYSLEPITKPNLFYSLQLNQEMDSIIGDIRDESKLSQVFHEYQPEIVFHLAAQPLVRFSYIEPKTTFETNVMGTINVYEASRKCKSVRTIINITSDKCYENKEWVYGYRENDPMGGYDPYSSSKGCSELVTSAYRNSFFNPNDYGTKHEIGLASVRAGNVIGGGDWSENRLIPDCIKALVKNKSIIIRSPHATRPWQHVLEPLSGYLWLGVLLSENAKKYSQGWNFGPVDQDVWTVEKVVQKITSIWKNGKYEIQLDDQLHEATLLKLDISNARFNLNWHPVYPADTAINETLHWYEFFYNNPITSKLKELTLKQITNYRKEACKTNNIWAKS